MRFRTAWVLALAAFPAAGQQPIVVLDDQFTRLDPAVWTGATNGPGQVGMPQAWAAKEYEGRDALVMASRLGAVERRGFLTVPAFPMRSTRVEVDFCPISGQGVPLEVWIIFPHGDRFIAAGPHVEGSGGGPNAVRVETHSGVVTFQPGVPWSHGRWYRFWAHAGPRSVRMGLMDERMESVWEERYPWRLCDFAPLWGVGVLQYRGAGEGVAQAAVDRVRITRGCGADADEDGALTGHDFGTFMGQWRTFSCAADLNDDRWLDAADVRLFVEAFRAGCL